MIEGRESEIGYLHVILLRVNDLCDENIVQF